jgi:Lar family restriction alleviation protein
MDDCPFCAGKAVVHEEPRKNGIFAIYVLCSECHAKGPDFLDTETNAEGNAVIAWNRRAPRKGDWGDRDEE